MKRKRPHFTLPSIKFWNSAQRALAQVLPWLPEGTESLRFAPIVLSAAFLEPSSCFSGTWMSVMPSFARSPAVIWVLHGGIVMIFLILMFTDPAQWYHVEGGQYTYWKINEKKITLAMWTMKIFNVVLKKRYHGVALGNTFTFQLLYKNRW